MRDFYPPAARPARESAKYFAGPQAVGVSSTGWSRFSTRRERRCTACAPRLWTTSRSGRLAGGSTTTRGLTARTAIPADADCARVASPAAAYACSASTSAATSASTTARSAAASRTRRGRPRPRRRRAPSRPPRPRSSMPTSSTSAGRRRARPRRSRSRRPRCAARPSPRGRAHASPTVRRERRAARSGEDMPRPYAADCAARQWISTVRRASHAPRRRASASALRRRDGGRAVAAQPLLEEADDAGDRLGVAVVGQRRVAVAVELDPDERLPEQLGRGCRSGCR